MQEKFVKSWKEQSIRGDTEAHLSSAKIKCNHIIFTKISKNSFSYLLKTTSALVFRNKNELLYTAKVALNKVFYIVIYGSFSLATKNGSFGDACVNGFTIGEEVLFEPTMTKRMELVRATQPSCCLRIDLEKFRNMSNISLGGNVRLKTDQMLL